MGKILSLMGEIPQLRLNVILHDHQNDPITRTLQIKLIPLLITGIKECFEFCTFSFEALDVGVPYLPSKYFSLLIYPKHLKLVD